VRSKTRAGTVVTLIPGNHDEYLRRFCDLQLGHIMVTAEAVHRTMDGRLFLVVHGDQFDGITRYHRWLAMTGDVGYDMLLVVNRWFNRGHRVRRDGTLELLSVASATTQGVTATRLALT
jgi:UDP-2,3-diacylglucosamine pyrophosphatase LpxH